MPTIAVTSAAPGAGKTGVAAAIARHYAYLGQGVRLVRLAGEGNADADAAFFASLDFVPGSPAIVVADHEPSPTALDVVECSLEQAAAITGAKSVLVGRGSPPAVPDGFTPTATVVLDAPRGLDGGDSTIVIREDRTLAGFSLDEVRSILNADLIVDGDAPQDTCDHLVIAPIASDAGQPYFRRFPSQAVVVRFDKTDMHLAAMQADPQFLILTGGRTPSDYLYDAASAKGVPVLLSRNDTENTVIALEGIFDRTRFQGQRKLDRMCELLEASNLFALLAIEASQSA